MSSMMANNTEAPLFDRPPRRVVSLVPSMTESMFDLGLGVALVGVTDYCRLPEAGVRSLPKVGGTKDARLDEILALDPDLVLANKEENNRQTIEALIEQGVPVWLTFPTSVQAALDVLVALCDLFRSQPALERVRTLDTAVSWARAAAASQEPLSFFCPIWQGQSEDGSPWWMTFNAQTYAHDLLSLVGGRNVFAERERRYPLAADLGLVDPEDPGERDTRYPRVTAAEVTAASPSLILLPDEPFTFQPRDRHQIEAYLADTPAVRSGNIRHVDGSLITWHGTRLGRALNQLPMFFQG